MQSIRARSACALALLGLILAACSTPRSDPPTALPDLPRPTPAPPSPMPPPTRRALVQPTYPSPSPAPSLTPLPPPFSYVFPIQPPDICSFQEGVQGHGYPATDIFAPVGAKYVAVTDGVVEFVSTVDEWDPANPDPARRSGLAVAILGNDGLRYYGSHLSGVAQGIATGQPVKAGQLLGFVGATGDARGKDSHLHFGISHPTTPDDWKTRRGEVDPYPYLLAWLAGQNLTPRLPAP